MISLSLLVFIFQLFAHIASTSAAGTINEILWQLYNKLPTPTSNASQEQAKQKREIIRLKKELSSISAQDEFSKWAKLRRQHDKVVAEYEKSASSTQSTRATFDRIVSVLRWLGLTGLRTFIQFWFSKQPLFWIPKGWVPYYAEWILSFPRAPLGSVSVNMWAIACSTVIGMISDAIIAAVALAMKQPAEPAKSEKTAKPMAIPAK